MVEAVVEFDYTAQESDELTIKKGDVIREIVKIPGGWWEGTLRDKRGMFPDNFVTVIQKDRVQQRNKSTRMLRQCRAIFSYHPNHDDELSLGVGDIIDVLGEVEEGWWKGRLGESEGVFPSNFVEEIQPNKSKNNSKEDLTSDSADTDSPNLPPKPSKLLCLVKYAYEACNEDELSLKEGDLITLISKDGQDRGWWRGELNGRVGVFPDNFVTVVPTAELNGPPLHKQSEKISPNKMSPQLSSDLKNINPNVAAHRKSLDVNKSLNITPPVPGKKPSVPKKSPQANPGILPSLKQKLTDVIDGAVSSRLGKHSDKDEKNIGDNKEKEKDAENDFDQVERSGGLLVDMRAKRVKAPGRRPPSTVYKDNELVNGNSDHSQQDTKSETSNDEEEVVKKPKVKEWEKNKAPWVAELKQNQAKRTSVSPSTQNDTRLKLTPTNDKAETTEITDVKLKSPHSHDTESSPSDMSKSMSALPSTKQKTPVNESDTVVLRSKTPTQPITISPVRPQTIHASPYLEPNKTSPIAPTQSHSPVSKPPIADKTHLERSPRSSIEKKPERKTEKSDLSKNEYVTMKEYMELADRITQIEQKMNNKLQEMQNKIDELQNKLQVESDMRRMFQAELEKVAQCVTQV